MMREEALTQRILTVLKWQAESEEWNWNCWGSRGQGTEPVMVGAGREAENKPEDVSKEETPGRAGRICPDKGRR